MRVLVTGGAGFLGRGLLRRVTQGKLDWEVTVYSRDETSQEEARQRYPVARYVLGDVRDIDLLTAAMMGHDWVVHAAAVKYIPEAELNATECVNVNVGGVENVVRAARTAGVRKVVGISTDKAVQPVNVYGCTKMLMERLFADTVRFEGQPLFCCVRYGNVIGSTGSVIPLFKRQLEEGGRVRITNPDMTRFWMSVDEAIDLILLALERASPGAVIVPPARAMKIVDVARAATQDGVDVEVIGERPGEKRDEMLMHYEESVRSLLHRDPMHYELLPPGNSLGKEAFTLASHSPNHWMKVSEMRRLIADAEEV
jgi:UDP-N-acetylglucosamine 4,6-dehydratase